MIHITSVCPFPRTTLSMIRRSMLLAATVSIHGATLETVAPEGPLLPAAFDVSIPFSIAGKAPIAIGSSSKSFIEEKVIEIEIMSTPSQ